MQSKMHNTILRISSLMPTKARPLSVVNRVVSQPCVMITWTSSPGSDAEIVAQHTFMIEEFLLACHENGEFPVQFKDTQKNVVLHGHCHQKALIGISPSEQVLSLPTGHDVEVIDSGCCGMAGSFGYEAEHYQVSMECGRRELFKAVEEKKGGL